MNFFTHFMQIFANTAHFLINILFPPRHTELIVRKLDFIELQKLVAPRKIKTDADISVTYLLPYQSAIVQALIVEAKFHGNTKAQKFLGMIFAEYIAMTTKAASSIDTTDHIGTAPSSRNPESHTQSLALVPIPLGKKRLKERGYNQVEQILKYAVSQTLSKQMVISNLLRRRRETTPQTSLGKVARLENMQGVFEVIPDVLYAEKTNYSTECAHILVDDVVTTGASLLAGYIALYDAGITNVQLLALSH